MKISSNYTSFSQNISFEGKLLLNGNYTREIRNAFYENSVLRNLAKSEYDIIGEIKTRVISSKREAYREGRDLGDIVYKFSLYAQKPCKGFLAKLFGLFLSKKSEMQAYQKSCSESTIIKYIKNLTDEEYIKNCLGI